MQYINQLTRCYDINMCACNYPIKSGYDLALGNLLEHNIKIVFKPPSIILELTLEE